MRRAAPRAPPEFELSPHRTPSHSLGSPRAALNQFIKGQKFHALLNHLGRQTFEEGSHGVYIDEFERARCYSGRRAAAARWLASGLRHTSKLTRRCTREPLRALEWVHYRPDVLIDPLKERSSAYAIAATSL